MPTTPKTAKKPQDRKPKSNSFGRKNVDDVEVPSGAVIKVIRPGLQGLIKAEIIDSFDQLTTIVQGETIPKAEGRPTVDVAKVVEETKNDPERIGKMLEMMDRIVKYVVVEPKLHEVPVLTEEQRAEGLTIEDVRDPELAYIDYVDDEDKAFIMQLAMGGSSDLERFRAESAQAMGSIQPLEAAADPTE